MRPLKSLSIASSWFLSMSRLSKTPRFKKDLGSILEILQHVKIRETKFFMPKNCLVFCSDKEFFDRLRWKLTFETKNISAEEGPVQGSELSFSIWKLIIFEISTKDLRNRNCKWPPIDCYWAQNFLNCQFWIKLPVLILIFCYWTNWAKQSYWNEETDLFLIQIANYKLGWDADLFLS